MSVEHTDSGKKTETRKNEEIGRTRVESLTKKVGGGVAIDAAPEPIDTTGLPDKLNLPERPEKAMNGTEFAEYLENLEKQTKEDLRKIGEKPEDIAKAVLAVREKAIYDQIMAGNVPSRMREFKNVEVEYTDPETKEKYSGVIRVLPDYLMVGSDDDAIRVSMTPALAQMIARNLGCTLPTDTMVDAITKEARKSGKRVQPHAMSTGEMDTVATLLAHNKIIDEELGDNDGNPLTDGPKKDIVIPYGNDGRGRVVIYGMHYTNGTRIQNYSRIHHDGWIDYSHGVRLVANKMVIRRPDGSTETKNVNEILADPKLHHMIARQTITNPSHQYNEKPGNRNEEDFVV